METKKARDIVVGDIFVNPNGTEEVHMLCVRPPIIMGMHEVDYISIPVACKGTEPGGPIVCFVLPDEELTILEKQTKAYVKPEE